MQKGFDQSFLDVGQARREQYEGLLRSPRMPVHHACQRAKKGRDCQSPSVASKGFGGRLLRPLSLHVFMAFITQHVYVHVLLFPPFFSLSIISIPSSIMPSSFTLITCLGHRVSLSAETTQQNPNFLPVHTYLCLHPQHHSPHTRSPLLIVSPGTPALTDCYFGHNVDLIY